jgi:hypothetical protein
MPLKNLADNDVKHQMQYKTPQNCGACPSPGPGFPSHMSWFFLCSVS